MSKDLNKVQVIGRLGKDPEMRFTAQGSAVTNFSVAAGRSWKDASGEAHEETEWFRCVAWEKLAEICNQYLVKGARVYVEGRLQTREYTDKDNIKRYSTEVVVNDMIMLDGKRTSDIGTEDAPDFTDAPPASAPRRPAGASPRPGAPYRNQPQPVSDDDIPF